MSLIVKIRYEIIIRYSGTEYYVVLLNPDHYTTGTALKRYVSYEKNILPVDISCIGPYRYRSGGIFNDFSLTKTKRFEIRDLNLIKKRKKDKPLLRIICFIKKKKKIVNKTL